MGVGVKREWGYSFLSYYGSVGGFPLLTHIQVSAKLKLDPFGLLRLGGGETIFQVITQPLPAMKEKVILLDSFFAAWILCSTNIRFLVSSPPVLGAWV